MQSTNRFFLNSTRGKRDMPILGKIYHLKGFFKDMILHRDKVISNNALKHCYMSKTKAFALHEHPQVGVFLSIQRFKTKYLVGPVRMYPEILKQTFFHPFRKNPRPQVAFSIPFHLSTRVQKKRVRLVSSTQGFQ